MGRNIARVERNIWAQSGDPTNTTYGTPIRGTIPSNNKPGPRGDNDAAVFHDTLAGVAGYYVRRNRNDTYYAGLVYTQSVWLKDISTAWVFFNGFGRVWFDIVNGVLGMTALTPPIGYGMEHKANDWYLCWASYFNPTEASANFYIFELSSNNGGVTDTGLDQDRLYFWNPQLSLGYGPPEIVRTMEVPIT